MKGVAVKQTEKVKGETEAGARCVTSARTQTQATADTK